MIRKTGFGAAGPKREGGAVGFGLRFVVSPVAKCERPGAPHLSLVIEMGATRRFDVKTHAPRTTTPRCKYHCSG